MAALATDPSVLSSVTVLSEEFATQTCVPSDETATALLLTGMSALTIEPPDALSSVRAQLPLPQFRSHTSVPSDEIATPLIVEVIGMVCTTDPLDSSISVTVPFALAVHTCVPPDEAGSDEMAFGADPTAMFWVITDP